MVNHFPFNWWLTSKAGLYRSLSRSPLGADNGAVADEEGAFIPSTFVLTKGAYDKTALAFEKYYNNLAAEDAAGVVGDCDSDEKDGDTDAAVEGPANGKARKVVTQAKPAFKNAWIMKPGRNSNRGSGISVVGSVEEVFAALGITKSAAEAAGSRAASSSARSGSAGSAAGGKAGRTGGGGSDSEGSCDDGDDDDVHSDTETNGCLPAKRIKRKCEWWQLRC